jgi:hypothetical protein
MARFAFGLLYGLWIMARRSSLAHLPYAML